MRTKELRCNPHMLFNALPHAIVSGQSQLQSADMANQDRDQPSHEYLTMNKPGVEIPGSNDYANCVFATRNLFLRVQRSINYFWITSVNLALRENLSSV